MFLSYLFIQQESEPLKKRQKLRIIPKGEFNPISGHRPCCVWHSPERAFQLAQMINRTSQNVTANSSTSSTTSTPSARSLLHSLSPRGTPTAQSANATLASPLTPQTEQHQETKSNDGHCEPQHIQGDSETEQRTAPTSAQRLMRVKAALLRMRELLK